MQDAPWSRRTIRRSLLDNMTGTLANMIMQLLQIGAIYVQTRFMHVDGRPSSPPALSWEVPGRCSLRGSRLKEAAYIESSIESYTNKHPYPRNAGKVVDSAQGESPSFCII
jgi:hypothetical protein